MQLMYTETPCFGENKRTPKITQNTRKYILRRATTVTISNFRGWRRKKRNRTLRTFSWRESRKKMMHTFNFFCLERWEGLSWNQFLLAVSARFSRIHFLHSGHRAGCVICFLWKNRCSPFVKTKVTSHCLHVTVMSCSGPSATASVFCCDATSSVGTSSIGIWIWSCRERKYAHFG